MVDIQFVSRSADGTSLILEDSEGNQFTLRVTDDIRYAVARAAIGTPDGSLAASPASPGEIQSLLRSGLSPHEVAEVTGSDLERVLRYYPPVEAEIQRAVSQAIAARVGNESDSPLMGELVVDRLAARGVDTDALAWTAARNEDGEWDVILSFPEGDVGHDARWSLNAVSDTVTALDDVAAALTETVAPPTIVHALFPPAQHFDPSTAPEARPRPDQIRQPTVEEELVDALNRARGVPQPVLEDIDGTEEDIPSTPLREVAVEDESVSEEVITDALLPSEGSEPSPALPSGGVGASQAPEPNAPEAPKRKRGRRPVPSWDEIVFGSRSDNQ